MSPRSQEFMDAARDWLGASRAVLGVGFGPGAVSNAYYAMLYAARAALSEEDLYAKTHSGTWNLFGETFAKTGRFDEALLKAARNVLPLRIQTDYEAGRVEMDKAEEVVELAERFLAAIDELYQS